ncbi:hypothetical protein B0J12DRAFT_56539 [Macrophomina phaseolina]|uniref:Uncharacterized protein n=1 Tax=Macrophomina phaseolina TaxID=35725 RepID=A0ABQ8GER7_9PEZI|nr:hypothetical protein B0J12DRAFT_56539 [Macrophomina phaseolina]
MKRRGGNRIAKAFETLNSASEKDLLCYKEEGRRTYERLQRLYTVCSASQPADSPSPSPSPEPDPPLPDNVKLLRRLEQQCATIEQYIRKSPEEAVCRACSWMNDDYRLVDIHVANGNPRPSNEEKFVKNLAFLNLAREYNGWEMENYRYSTLNVLKSGKTTPKTSGHISSFIRDKKFSKARTAQTGIQHGLKLLHIEAKAGRSAIAAFLALADCPLSWLHHPTVDDFIRVTKSSEKIWKLAEDMAAWFDRCQFLYQDLGQSWERKKPNAVIHSRSQPSVTSEPLPKRLRVNETGDSVGREPVNSLTELANIATYLTSVNSSRLLESDSANLRSIPSRTECPIPWGQSKDGDSTYLNSEADGHYQDNTSVVFANCSNEVDSEQPATQQNVEAQPPD